MRQAATFADYTFENVNLLREKLPSMLIEVPWRVVACWPVGRMKDQCWVIVIMLSF